MSQTPTYGELRDAITAIKDATPDAAGWPEIVALESLVPDDPSAWDTPLPATALDPVERLVRRPPTGPWDFPIVRPSGLCGLLAGYVISETTTYRTLRDAITAIKQGRPDAADWPEIVALESLVPDDPTALDMPLPATALDAVALLVRLPPTDPWDFPIVRPFGLCQLLAAWVESRPL